MIEANLLLRLRSIKSHLGFKNSSSLYLYFRTYLGSQWKVPFYAAYVMPSEQRQIQPESSRRIDCTGKWILKRKLDGSLCCENSATCCDGCDMLEEMVSIRYDSQLNNQLHLRFDEASRTNELEQPISKLFIIFANYFVFAICDIWIHMELWWFCAWMKKYAAICFENACLFNFCLKRHSRPHFHLFFIFDHWFCFMVAARGTYSVVLARWK